MRKSGPRFFYNRKKKLKRKKGETKYVPGSYLDLVAKTYGEKEAKKWEVFHPDDIFKNKKKKHKNINYEQTVNKLMDNKIKNILKELQKNIDIINECIKNDYEYYDQDDEIDITSSISNIEDEIEELQDKLKVKK